MVEAIIITIIGTGTREEYITLSILRGQCFSGGRVIVTLETPEPSAQR